ncbi:hypothetical protein EBH_0056220 [Eimeria brunetti]|uniref:Uncharacterized protein n=1 Tax=Eimeria brunetti TaxID=51314 RepID=U6M2J6_9EIME|nr:hypothetical protein EBH_0056220 [Eimeria brunetti]
MDLAIGLIKGISTESFVGITEEKQALGKPRHPNSSAAAACLVSDHSLTSTCSGPTSQSNFSLGGAAGELKCQFDSDDAAGAEGVASAAGDASSAEAEVAVVSDPSSSDFVASGNLSVKTCSSRADEGFQRGELAVPPSGSARCRIVGQRRLALNAPLFKTEMTQATEATGLSCEGGIQASPISSANKRGYLSRNSGTEGILKHTLTPSAEQKFFQKIRVHTVKREPFIGDTIDSASSAAEKRAIMCCDAETDGTPSLPTEARFPLSPHRNALLHFP